MAAPITQSLLASPWISSVRAPSSLALGWIPSSRTGNKASLAGSSCNRADEHSHHRNPRDPHNCLAMSKDQTKKARR
jgi:hypothetical protein